MPPKTRKPGNQLTILPDGLQSILDRVDNPIIAQQLGELARRLAAINEEIRLKQRTKRDTENQAEVLRDIIIQERLAVISDLSDYFHDPGNDWTIEELTEAVRVMFPDFEFLDGRERNYLKSGNPVIVETDKGYRGGFIESLSLGLAKRTYDGQEGTAEIKPQYRLTIESTGGDDTESAENSLTIPITPNSIGKTVLKSRADVLERLYRLGRSVEWSDGFENAVKYFGLVTAARQTFDGLKIPPQQYEYVKDDFFIKVADTFPAENRMVPRVEIFSHPELGATAIEILKEHMWSRYSSLDNSVALILASSEIKPGDYDRFAAEFWVETQVRQENPDLEGSDLVIAISEKRFEYIRHGVELTKQAD